MTLRDAAAGLTLIVAAAIGAPEDAMAAVLRFDDRSSCVLQERSCLKARQRAPEGQGGLILAMFGDRARGPTRTKRAGPPPDRVPFSAAPGKSGSAAGGTPFLITPLPGGGLLMLTALGAVVLIRRKRHAPRPI